MQFQLAVVAEIRQLDLVAARQVEAEFTGAHIAAGWSPGVEGSPATALLYLVHDSGKIPSKQPK